MGGGIILSATAGISGCTSEMPAEAIAAWQGPGDEPDVRRWIQSYAILAPHSHNLQSWLVDLKTPGEIVLYCDTNRLLPGMRRVLLTGFVKTQRKRHGKSKY